MISTNNVGRIIGALLVVQLAGLIVPFILLHPLTAGPSALGPGAAIGFQVRVAVLLLLENCALTVGISFAAFPLLRRHSHAMALLLVTASAIMFSLQAVDNAHLLSMLSLRQQYAEAGGPEELFETLAMVARSTRKWVHYAELLAIDAWIFVLYGALFRFALVPRALAGFGLVTVLLHFTWIVLPFLLGLRSVMLLGVPMALSHLALASRLMAKGVTERPHPGETP